MKKDKEWLKEELLRDLMRFNGNPNMTDYELGIASGIGTAINLTEKLEEQELTQRQVDKWLDKRDMVAVDAMMVHQTGMQNKVVVEKPVIPQFVADYIELNKGWSEDRQEYIEDDSSGLWFALDGNSYGMPNSVSDWLFNEEKVETFARAWLDGYEVEKEPQWVVRYEDGYFSEEIKFGCGIDGDWVDEVSRAYHFTDKTKAEAVALLIGGTVEEVRE